MMDVMGPHAICLSEVLNYGLPFGWLCRNQEGYSLSDVLPDSQIV